MTKGGGAKVVRVGDKRYERIDKPGVSGEDTKDSSEWGNNSHNFFACLCYFSAGYICFALSLCVSGGLLFFFPSK